MVRFVQLYGGIVHGPRGCQGGLRAGIGGAIEVRQMAELEHVNRRRMNKSTRWDWHVHRDMIVGVGGVFLRQIEARASRSLGARSSEH